MKKTIAKIMAAAMILSAVPAVAMPTLTAEAATTVTVSTVYALDDEDLPKSGNTGVNVQGVGGSLASGDYSIYFESNDSTAITSGDNKGYTLEDILTYDLNSDGDVIVSLDKDVTDYAKILTNAVNTKKNYVKMYIKKGTATLVINGETITDNNTNVAKFYVGGDVTSTTDKTIKSGIVAEEGSLHSGDVYAKITNNTALEVEILKGKNDDMDGNDDLRGQMLNLDTVTIGGIEYKVVKIGAQALKKAHMKKFQAQNTKKIGKGALRKCKQVKKADFEDGQKVRKIHEKAFYDCKNLNTIIIDGRKLSVVGKNAFHGVKKNCTVKIKAKKSKFESDKKLILKNGGNKNLKFVRK